MARIRVALCQINTTVGDLDGNVARIVAALEEAETTGCDLAVFPELALTGYPPEDLLLKPGFIGDNRRALEQVAAATASCAAVVGFVDAGRDLYNAAAVCAFGRVQAIYHKRNLPNYAVFDEQRYFAAGTGASPLVEVAGVRVGVSICEDAFSPTGPIATQAAGGAEMVVNINASPYYAGRLAERERMLAEGERARAEAEAAAEQIRASAREQGRHLVGEAQMVRERMLGDLSRRRHVAREQLERLNGARERLLAAYAVVKRTVDEATTELTVALPEARAASEQAMRRVSDEPAESVEVIEAELSVARMGGLDAAAAAQVSDEELDEMLRELAEEEAARAAAAAAEAEAQADVEAARERAEAEAAADEPPGDEAGEPEPESVPSGEAAGEAAAQSGDAAAQSGDAA
ncbi:MAG: hypothetical protein PV358_19470, partial [Acidimicrobiales bacterium]|nr:hypothetical protein [Acidimicrobiales bacterium]